MNVEYKLNVKTIFRNTTAIGCISFTIWLGAVQFFKYKENEDLSKLSYRRFIYDSKSESSPPTYTICISKKGAYHSSNLFMDPNITIIPNISNYGYEEDRQLYYDFLAGNLRKKLHNWKTLELLDFDSEMKNLEKLYSTIEFEDFSIDLIDDLLHQFISGKFSKNYYLDLLHECNESLSPNIDCMSTLMPKVHQNLKVVCYSRMFYPETDNEMSSDFILLNTSKLFEMGLDLSLHVHQTGQLIRHLFSSISPEGDLSSTDLIKFGKEFRHKIESNPNKKNTQNTVHLTINDVTILRKRKNSNTPCDDKSKNEDERVRSFILNKLGCVPAYWNIFNTNASSQKEMKSCGFIDYESMNKIKKGVFGEFKQFFDNYTRHNDELCSDMRRSVTNFEESTTDVFGHWIELVITYLNKDYMEIRNIEAYTMESLLGQVGGFVGIFVGYSVLQIGFFLAEVLCSTFAAKNKVQEAEKVITWKENAASKQEELCINPKGDREENEVCATLEKDRKIKSRNVEHGLDTVLKAIEELRLCIETNTNDIKNIKQYTKD